MLSIKKVILLCSLFSVLSSIVYSAQAPGKNVLPRMCNSREVANGDTDECWLEPPETSKPEDAKKQTTDVEDYEKQVDEDAPVGPLKWRIAMNFSRGGYSPNGKGLTIWRLLFAHYFTKRYSLFFLTQIPMTSPSISEYKHLLFNVGGAWHYWYPGDFEFLVGASAGLASVSHLTKTSQATVDVDVSTSILYNFQIFHLYIEANYQYAKYTADGSFNLSQFMFGAGFGFKF